MRTSFVALLLLCGCVQTVAYDSPVVSRTGCCTQYTDISFVPVKMEQESEFEVSENSPTFAFATGSSYVIGLQLPKLNDQAYLEVTALPTSIVSQLAWFFFPAVTYLDERFKEMTTVMDEQFRATESRWGTSAFTAEVPVPAGARYAVIHTPKAKVGTVHSAPFKQHGMLIPMGRFFIPVSGNVQKRMGRLGSTGPILVILRPAKSAK